MATAGWNKYNRFKAMGGIAKKARNKAQGEIINLLKASEDNNFETVMNRINVMHNELKQAINNMGMEIQALKEEIKTLKK